MNLKKDQMNDKIILTLGELEYTMVINALRDATSDDSRKGIEYMNFYEVERGEMVSLFNSINTAENNC
jgi:hypothetical protein